jgi:hypothetical protein
MNETNNTRDRARSKNARHNAGEFKIVNGVRVRIGDAPLVNKKSEFIGVTWVPSKKLWQALFTDPHTGFDLSLGYFVDDLCAASAYNRHVSRLIANGETYKFRLNKLRAIFELRRSMNEDEGDPCK